MQKIAEKESTLLEILSVMAPESSKTTLRSWIKEGRVSVDGCQAQQSNDPIAKGQKVVVGVKKQFIATRIPILYEDSHFVAIEKPMGLLSVATAFEKGETAHALLKAHYHPRKVYVVHRLDQETSGVMLFALSEEGHQELKNLFEKHDIERKYCAIVEGRVEPLKGTWKSYVYEDSAYFVHSSDNPEEGALAITHYKVVGFSNKYTQLELNLETGRKNQIRVHCAASGHPVVGDKKYGAVLDPLKRLCLYAEGIAFIHPITGKKIRIESPIPEAMASLVKARP